LLIPTEQNAGISLIHESPIFNTGIAAPNITNSLGESSRAPGAPEFLSAGLGHAVREREAEALGDQLLDVGALDVLGLLDLNDTENLVQQSQCRCLSQIPVIHIRKTYVDRPEAGSMASSHILVESLDGICPRHLTVLLVHVVGAGPRVVSDPDAKVLDLLRVLLLNLFQLLGPTSFNASARPSR